MTTARKINPTVRWTVGGDGLTEPNLNFHFPLEMKMQTSLVTRFSGKRSDVGENNFPLQNSRKLLYWS